jgi:hypothetical protein
MLLLQARFPLHASKRLAPGIQRGLMAGEPAHMAKGVGEKSLDRVDTTEE